MTHTTVHHIRPDVSRDYEMALRYDGIEPTADVLNHVYTPAETITGIGNPADAYGHAQGETVNRTQGGRHMVASAQVGDVLECVHSDHTEWFKIEPVGFTQLEIDGEVENAGTMPHENPLLVRGD